MKIIYFKEGEFRVDANVSVSRHPDEMGTRTEVKNINRFKGIQKAVGKFQHVSTELNLENTFR